MSERVWVLLPVHQRREITRRFAACLAAQTWPGIQLLLLDDGSTDGTAEAVRALLPGTVVLRGDGTWWWAGALQAGLDWLAAQGAPGEDVLLLVNDDTEFGPDFVAAGVAALRAAPGALVGARAVDRLDGRLLDPGQRVDWRRLRFQPAADPQQVNCLSTRGLFLRLADARAAGGFRPRLLPHYLSDYEFTVRARRRGLALRVDPGLVLRLDTGTPGGLSSRPGQPLPLRALFSRRSTEDPRAWAAFVALACPWPWKPLHLAAVAGRAALAVARAGARALRPGDGGRG